MVGVIAILIAGIGFFLHREMKNNDEAHKDLRKDIQAVETDVKKLLTGDAPWVKEMRADLREMRAHRSHGTHPSA